MKNLFTTMVKKHKKAKREWYTADMLAGELYYRTSVMANSEEEAIEIIMANSAKGNSLLQICK